MIRIVHKGDFRRTKLFFRKSQEPAYLHQLEQLGKDGVQALAQATPVQTGRTAASWEYRIIRNGTSFEVDWYNTNIKDGVPIAVIIQTGHGTGTGGYVEGIDYIPDAIRPIIDDFVGGVWREVKAR